MPRADEHKTHPCANSHAWAGPSLYTLGKIRICNLLVRNQTPDPAH
jgi:hypothetical protein